MKKKFILLSGKKQSGKSTVAKYLHERYNYREYYFSYFLKRQCYEFATNVLQMSNISFTNFLDNNLKEIQLDVPYSTEKISARTLMQKFSERFIKPVLGENYYINYLINQIQGISHLTGLVVLSDFRFKNEIMEIKKYFIDYNICTIRIEREKLENNDNHLSEIDLDDYKDWDYIIENNETLEELYAKIDKIILEEK